MKNIFLFLAVVLPSFLFAQADSLDNYINRVKQSKQAGGSETAFLSLGSDFLYAQEYFEAGNFSSAESSFKLILYSHKDHPYSNYQLAISLLKQNDPFKKRQAKEFLDIAFNKVPSLKERYEREFPTQVNAVGSQGFAEGSLEQYIDRIRYSRATGGKETEMLSAGLEAFYAIEYYEKQEFRSAETGFRLSLAKDSMNPFVNYMLAVSLSATGKNAEAKKYLDKAVQQRPELKTRFTKDSAKAIAAFKSQQKANNPSSSSSSTVNYGGKLVYGNYTCHQSVWNGPNASPAYSYKYHGYFQLRSDGTYRWLDNGATGKYKYDEKTGTITWLSGYFKAAPPKSTRYRTDPKVPQVTVTFSENYRWECGCKK